VGQGGAEKLHPRDAGGTLGLSHSLVHLIMYPIYTYDHMFDAGGAVCCNCRHSKSPLLQNPHEDFLDNVKLIWLNMNKKLIKNENP